MIPIVSDYSAVESSTEESLFESDSDSTFSSEVSSFVPETDDEGSEETLLYESDESSVDVSEDDESTRDENSSEENSNFTQESSVFESFTDVSSKTAPSKVSKQTEESKLTNSSADAASPTREALASGLKSKGPKKKQSCAKQKPQPKKVKAVLTDRTNKKPAKTTTTNPTNDTKHGDSLRDDDFLPDHIPLGCDNEDIRKILRDEKVCGRIIEILTEYNALRCPESRNDLAPFEPLSSCVQVYCIFAKNDPKRIIKIGYSGNLKERYAKTPEVYKLLFVIVSGRMIPKKANELIGEICRQVLDRIMQIKSIGRDYRHLCHTVLHRGADDLGLFKAFCFQLIEIACQRKYKQAVPAEIFTTGAVVQEERRARVKIKSTTWTETPEMRASVGKKVIMMSTWPTGKQKERLSSQCVGNGKVMDGRPWEDAMLNPVVPSEERTTGEDMFRTDWPEHEVEEGRKRVKNCIQKTKDKGFVLLLDRNEERLFPQNRLLAIILNDYGFELRHKIYGSVAVMLVHGEAIIILKCPFGFAMDSRLQTIPLSRQQLRTFEVMEVLYQGVRFLSNKPMIFGTSHGNDCLTAAFFFESVWKFFHLHRRTAAAVARDALTPDDVFACRQNGLQKVSKANAPYFTMQARRENRRQRNPTDRPLQANIVLQGANILSLSISASDEILWKHLDRVYELFRSGDVGDVTSDIIGIRWKALVENHVLPGRLKDVCEHYVKSFKKNGGNRLPYKPFDIEINNDILKDLYDGREFLIHKVTPANDDIRYFDPKSIPDSLVSESGSKISEMYYIGPEFYVFEGLRERLKQRINKNNINAVKAQQMEGPRKKMLYRQKLFCYPDGSKEPVLKGWKAPKTKFQECFELRICKLVDK